MSEFIKQIGISSHPVARSIARMLRLPILAGLWPLLRFRKGVDAVSRIQTIQNERGFMMWPDEMMMMMMMMMIFLTARALKDKKGDFAEFGVSTAGSAKVIASVKGDTVLHLFDTFEGLPETDTGDTHLSRGQYACSLPAVKEYLKEYSHVVFHQGLFPESATGAASRTFSFVHLDVDLYRSTLDGLIFFYPRLERGGVLISHDYSTVPGVKRAFDEYFADRPETVLELPTSQCLVIKS